MEQIIILTDNRSGVIAEICESLAAENINVESMDAETHLSKGVVIITVDKYDEALQVLRDGLFQAISEESILIRLDDKPGELAKIAKRFKDADINLKSLRILQRDGTKAIVALIAADFDNAAKLVEDVQIK